jgi:hypothetical protein
MADFIKERIGDLKVLESLDFESNWLNDLPKRIGDLKHSRI